MIALILIGVSTFFAEISAAIGKRKVAEHKESIYTMGFLNIFWFVILFFVYGLFISGNFVFVAASLPTFGVRAFLEIFQAHFTMKAIAVADRSTFGFLRIWTIPLLLIVDLVLGYSMTTFQIAGIFVIIIGFIFLFLNHGIKKKGAGIVMFTAINAVATISLYKYNITHFNSVEAEAGVMGLILLLYFFFMARLVAHEKPLVDHMRQPVFLAQSLFAGAASVLASFVYVFAPASIITAMRRSFTIFGSMVSGNILFHEKKFFVKLVAFLFIAGGIALLATS